MGIGFLLILIIPSAVLFYKYPLYRGDILMQVIIVLVLLFIGWRLIKISGCLLRIIGIVMVLAGMTGYYYLIIQPLLTGAIITFGIFK